MDNPERITQVPNGCWAACLAGLTGIPHEVLTQHVPTDIPLDDKDAFRAAWDTMHNAIVDELHNRGWTYLNAGTRIPRGFAIGSGMSPRGIMHACIVLDGQVWHDPHPSHAGVERFTMYEIVVPILGVQDAA